MKYKMYNHVEETHRAPPSQAEQKERNLKIKYNLDNVKNENIKILYESRVDEKLIRGNIDSVNSLKSSKRRFGKVQKDQTKKDLMVR